KHVVLMESRSEAALSQLPSLLFYDDLLRPAIVCHLLLQQIVIKQQ
ncbi:hypothetical protein GTI87_21220, partial [Klebsiella pneumoniae]|nr:hypothetical protein [Klebsiella pneumoniae]